MDSFEKSGITIRQVFRWGLVSVFVAPFFLLVALFGKADAVDWPEFYWAFKNTFLQSALSAGSCLVLGCFFSLGLRWIHEARGPSVYQMVRALLLLPALLPSLFVLLVGFELISPFPRGFVGITLMHTLASAGLCAVIIEGVISNKLAALSESAWVLGSSKWLFWRKAVRAILFDLAAVFSFVFVYAFSSFAIPLIIGGSSGTTIEVLIYEKIRISSNWGQAIVLSVLQAILLAGLSLLPTRSLVAQVPRYGSPLLRSLLGAVSALLYGASFVVAFCFSGFSGWTHLLQLDPALRGTWEVLPVSVGLATAAWFGFYFLFKGLSYFFEDVRLPQFLKGYVAPSVALIGLVGVSLTGWTTVASFFHGIVYLLCLMILFLPSLFRMNWQGKRASLDAQIRTAQVLGASSNQIFHRILWPQMRDTAFFLSLIGALWVMGDFALAKIIFSQPITLALKIESLLTSYRLEAAMALAQVWILAAFILSLLLWGGHRVRR